MHFTIKSAVYLFFFATCITMYLQVGPKEWSCLYILFSSPMYLSPWEATKVLGERTMSGSTISSAQAAIMTFYINTVGGNCFSIKFQVHVLANLNAYFNFCIVRTDIIALDK